MQAIQAGMLVFLGDGQIGIGSIQDVASDHVVVQIENAGAFKIPRASVRDVHFDKVILAEEKLDRSVIDAIKHAHDRENKTL